MDFTVVEQAPYTTPQTATVSDEAVQVALDKWFGADHYEYKNACFDDMRLTLTAAYPHLALSAAAARAQAFEEIAHIANQQKEYWDNKQKDCKALEDAYSENGDTYTPLGDDEAWKAGYANGHFSEACWLLGTIRALSPAEPVDQWQDIATAPKDGEPILIWKPDEHRVGEYIMSAYWCDDREGFVPVGGIHKQGYYSDTAQCNQGYPTHWMPLPTAPTSKGGE